MIHDLNFKSSSAASFLVPTQDRNIDVAETVWYIKRIIGCSGSLGVVEAHGGNISSCDLNTRIISYEITLRPGRHTECVPVQAEPAGRKGRKDIYSSRRGIPADPIDCRFYVLRAFCNHQKSLVFCSWLPSLHLTSGLRRS